MTNPEDGDRVQAVRPAAEQDPQAAPAPAAAPAPVPPPAPAAAPAPAVAAKPVTRSRLGGLWIALTSGAVVLLLLMIFILENGQRVDIAYFGAHGHLPLGVALLLAAIFGILLVVIPGAGRMLQLRMAARRQGRLARARPSEAVPPGPAADLAGAPEQSQV